MRATELPGRPGVHFMPGGDYEGAPKPEKKPNGHARRDRSDHQVILLVDDSEQDQALVSAALGEFGMAGALRWAKSHDEALAYFSGRPPFDDRAKNPVPSLVLLDIQLPSSDGFSLLGWLRSQQQAAWHRVPVVMLTTSQAREEIVRAYDMGANSFLTKPTSFSELVVTLQAATDYWLKQNRGA